MADASFNSTVANNAELAERMASITEELEDIVQISNGQKPFKSAIISRNEIMSMISGEKKHGDVTGADAFRMIVVKNLLQGRLLSVAYKLGKSIVESLDIRSEKDIVECVGEFGIKVKVKNIGPDKVLIEQNSGITAKGVTGGSVPICYFEAGMYSGLLENMFHKKMDIIETKCACKGDKFCQFEIYDPDSKHANMRHIYPVDMYAGGNLKLLTSLAAHSVAAIENAIILEKTRKQVVIDGLTEVFNRRYFESMIDVELKRAQRYKMPISLFMLDVDDFKKINDKYGHQCGDEVLKIVASTLVGNVRNIDVVSRYGGDEFAIILPQTDEQGARVVAERIIKNISNIKGSSGQKSIKITISIGGVSIRKPKPQCKIADIVRNADESLFKAKIAGKNKVELVWE